MGRHAAYFDRITLTPEKYQERRDFIRKCLDRQPAEIEPGTCSISSCMAGRGAFWISWDGNMYPCGMLPHLAEDVRKAGFLGAWEKICVDAAAMPVPSECRSCSYQKLCPSCAAVSMSLTGKTDGLADVLCRRTKSYVDVFLSEI